MTVQGLRSLLYNLEDTDEVKVCNVQAPLTGALQVEDAIIITKGAGTGNKNSELLLTFDTRKDGK